MHLHFPLLGSNEAAPRPEIRWRGYKMLLTKKSLANKNMISVYSPTMHLLEMLSWHQILILSSLSHLTSRHLREEKALL